MGRTTCFVTCCFICLFAKYEYFSRFQLPRDRLVLVQPSNRLVLRKHLACNMPAPVTAAQSSAMEESSSASEGMPMCRGIRAARGMEWNWNGSEIEWTIE